jgi:hypothetical protein
MQLSLAWLPLDLKRAIAADLLSEASGRAERDAALLMAEALPAGKRVTLGRDKNYDTQEFVRPRRRRGGFCGFAKVKQNKRGPLAPERPCDSPLSAPDMKVPCGSLL